MDAPKLTGLKKRQQIKSANQTMFLWVIGASVALAICIVLAQFMVRQLLFNSDIIGAKKEAQSTLQTNINTVDDLKSSVNKLTANENLSKLRLSQTDSALQVIIDALPTTDDRAALATSMQQVVLAKSGVGIDTLSVTDSQSTFVAPTTTTTATTPSVAATPIAFTFSITGDYNKISQAIQDIERSIRPISIETLQITGTGDLLKATISANTYYQPPKTVQLTKRQM